MKRTVILLCVLFLAPMGQVHAEMGDQFWFLKAGMLWRDVSDKPDSMQSLGLTYGYGLTQRFSLEIDYDRTIAGGAYKRTNSNGLRETGEYALWLASANISYRHLLFTSLYLKVKAGYTYGSESRSSNIEGSKDETLQGVGASLGLGYLAGAFIGTSTTIELSYTMHKQDVSAAVLGINLTF